MKSILLVILCLMSLNTSKASSVSRPIDFYEAKNLATLALQDLLVDENLTECKNRDSIHRFFTDDCSNFMHNSVKTLTRAQYFTSIMVQINLKNLDNRGIDNLSRLAKWIALSRSLYSDCMMYLDHPESKAQALRTEEAVKSLITLLSDINI